MRGRGLKKNVYIYKKEETSEYLLPSGQRKGVVVRKHGVYITVLRMSIVAPSCARYPAILVSHVKKIPCPQCLTVFEVKTLGYRKKKKIIGIRINIIILPIRGRGMGKGDDSAEILFQSILREAIVSNTGMGKDCACS